MPTNYDVSGTDLEDIFQIQYSQQASATGLTVNGSDLNTYFEKKRWRDKRRYYQLYSSYYNSCRWYRNGL